MFTEKNVSTLENAKTLGERVKALRKDILGLSWEKFCEFSGNLFSRRALSIWEKDETPLNDSSVKKLVNAFSIFNIQVTENWLKTGQGDLPKETLINLEETEEADISNEILFFTQKTCHGKNYCVANIEDDAMSPVFETGDIVAGKKVKNSEINSLKGTYCILTLNNENTLVRKLEITTEGQIVLISKNEAYSPIVNPKIISAAEVIWRRRRATVVN